jgi:hypothetical protein
MQEDGWVVCRVFTKKSYTRGMNPAEMAAFEDDELLHPFPVSDSIGGAMQTSMDQKHIMHNSQLMQQHSQQQSHYDFPSFDASMQLPQLTSAEHEQPPLPSYIPAVAMSSLEVECSQNLMKLTSGVGNGMLQHQHGGGGSGDPRFAASTDWSILDKLLASHQNLDHLFQGKITSAAAASMAPYQQQQLMEQLGLGGSSTSSMERIPLQYLGCQATDLLRFSK